MKKMKGSDIFMIGFSLGGITVSVIWIMFGGL